MRKTQRFIAVVLIITTFVSKSWAQDAPKIGLALSGGGAKGVAHIGVLKVFEKEGIPVHFIGGTSAGSIVGSLFAMGYTAEEIETLALTLDWSSFISDKPLRKDVLIDLKEVDDKTFFSFPFENFKFSLPSSIVPGHKITNLFSEIMLPAYRAQSFDELPIPFLCIAADAITGEEVVLDSGNLAYAVRASMAIPSVVSPVEINDQLLVDGGVVNNFPVKRVKEMGADLVIGVDLRSPEPSKEELENLLSLVMQTIFYRSEQVAEENAKVADVLIKCDMSQYSTGSFNAIEAIIAEGERAATEALPKIRAMLGYDVPPYKEVEKTPVHTIDSLYMSSVSIHGNHEFTSKYVYKSLDIKNNQWVKVDDINQSIKKLYATQNFEYVFYRLEPLEGKKVNLILDLKEKKTNSLNIGLRFDRDLDAAILLNLLSRNVGLKNSIMKTDFRISSNPEFIFDYFVYTGFKTAFGTKVAGSKIESFLFYEDNKIGVINSGNLSGAAVLKLTFAPSFEMGLASEIEFYELNNEFGILDNFRVSNVMFNPYAYLLKDTYDNVYFPKKGGKIFVQFKSVNELSSRSTLDAPSQLPEADLTNFGVLKINYSRAFNIDNRLTIVPRLDFGTTIRYFPNQQLRIFKYQQFMGGETHKYEQIVPFPGLNFAQEWAENVAAVNLDLQWALGGGTYFITRTGAGNVKNTREDLVDLDDITYGYSIALATKTPIGPFEMAMVGSNKLVGPSFTITIGYRF